MLTGNRQFTYFRKCFVCNESNSAKIAEVPYLINFKNEMIKYDHNLAKCKNCGNYFVNPVLQEEILSDYYNSSSSYEMYDNEIGTIGPYLNKAKQQYDFVSSDSIPKKIDILDFGCATGYNLASFDSHNNRLLGFDTSAECSEVAKRKYNITVETDFKKIVNRKFDLIMMSHVLEHLSDPQSVIHSLSELLKPDGQFYIEVPDVDFLDSLNNPRFIFEHLPFEHLNYFNKKSLISFMGKVGLVASKIQTSFNDENMMPNYPVILSLWKKGHYEEGKLSSESLSFETYLTEQTSKKAQFRERVMSKVGSKRVVIYGAGTHTYRLLALCPDLIKQVTYFADSNVKKQEKAFFEGKMCKDIRSIPLNEYDVILISSENSENEIYQYLKSVETLNSKIIERIYN